jgi:hypothetical protein
MNSNESCTDFPRTGGRQKRVVCCRELGDPAHRAVVEWPDGSVVGDHITGLPTSGFSAPIILYQWDGESAVFEWLTPEPPVTLYVEKHRKRAFEEFIERITRYAVNPVRAVARAKTTLRDATPTGRPRWAAWVQTDADRRGVLRP